MDTKFKIDMNQKLESIKEKLNTIVKFKEDIAIVGLKTIEKVIYLNADIALLCLICLIINVF